MHFQALDKIHSELLTESSKLNSDKYLYIEITLNKNNRTLTILDTGVGMTKADLIKNLGNVVRPRTKSLMEAKQTNWG